MNADATAVLRVIETGFGASIQDLGRPGWRRFGVPPSGCMDFHAADCANRLLDNERSAAVIEVLLGGCRFEMLRPAWVAITGAAVKTPVGPWRAYHAEAGELITLRQGAAGVWIYLAIEGGFLAPHYFGSASHYGRGGIGMKLEKNLALSPASSHIWRLPPGVAGRVASWEDQRDYAHPPPLRVWTGPQWNSFSSADRDLFLNSDWTVRPESDRVGYRLSGPALKANPPEIFSEAVRVGSVQAPEAGQPIVTMRDGPTVGGYPKIALVDDEDLPWLAQCRPGQIVRFKLIE